MLRIVTGGLPEDIGNYVQRRLESVCLRGAPNREGMLEELACGEISLLILDGGFLGESTTKLLEEIRNLPAGRDVPVVYCLDENLDGVLVRTLVNDLHVREVMLAPLDPEEVA
ncbi:MAG TPA: hypothetical protein VFJ52_06815, partial [Terriglobia bacterium]|nr:hypothetical protein [Terriglobia bacterium]